MAIHKFIYIILLIALFLFSCQQTDSESESDVPPVSEDTISTTTTEIDEPEEQTIWAVYQGRIGLYNQPIVMELAITGNQVVGSYFYAKHQKTLNLHGEMDPVTNQIFLEEQYKGKTTGYMEFTLVKGVLEGFWKKSLSAKEKEDFNADYLDVGVTERAKYKPRFFRYENNHTVTMYDGVEDYDQEVQNVLTMADVGNGNYCFYYHVVCTNGHQGGVEGMAKKTEVDVVTFSDNDQCNVHFQFKMDGKTDIIEVTEEGDCSYYKGARAYLGDILTKVK